MTAVYPTSIVSTSNIPDANPLTTLSANNHAGKHNDLRDEIIAIETKIGVTGSAVNTSLEYKTKNITAGDQAVGATQTVSLSNKTLVSPKVTVGSDAIGDIDYNSSGATGVQARLPIGSTGQVLTSNGTVPIWSSPSASNTNYIVDTGAANAYVATLSPALGAYTAGVLVQFKAANANTTASTVNVNGLGAKTIKKLGGATDLASGDIAAGMVVSLEYDGTNFVMLNPSALALNSNGDGSSLTGVKLQNAKNGVLSVNSSTTNTITIGFQARAVRISATYNPGAGTSVAFSNGSWDVSSAASSCAYFTNNPVSTGGTNTNTGYTIISGASCALVVSNVTSTTFDIISTVSGSITTAVYWEAIA